jgi:FAD/FMN-containing dehydrogenase
MQLEPDTLDLEADAHEARVAQALAQVHADGGGLLALDKRTSNLFRDRAQGERRRLDLSAFTHVIDADPDEGWVDVEGLCTYEDLVAWCLPQGFMPAVVPQLRTITAGGAVSGVAIEASSFRHGLVHHTLRELEVLLPQGEVVTCDPTNAHADLFHGFPNSYGSLGYALRLRLATQPVRPYVAVRHRRFAHASAFFEALQAACEGDADFVDGVVFAPGDLVLSTARFADTAPWRSDYGYLDIYWRSLREREEDWLSTADWLWRWDTDWFWCSSHFGAQHALVRRLLGRGRLNSRTWQRWMRAASRHQLAQRLAHWRGRYRESVIQDVDIPLAHAPAFLDFLHDAIGILPVWICPLRGDTPGERFPLYPLQGARWYVNFGFWDAVERRGDFAPGHFNRLIEGEVARLGGIKSLYSDSFYPREAFDRAYGGAAYARLKAKYDPQHRAPDLYDKTVGRR